MNRLNSLLGTKTRRQIWLVVIERLPFLINVLLGACVLWFYIMSLNSRWPRMLMAEADRLMIPFDYVGTAAVWVLLILVPLGCASIAGLLLKALVIPPLREWLRIDPVCDLKGHTWKNCRCSNPSCIETRHDWDACVCKTCKATRHEWEAWEILPGSCQQTRTCRLCGQSETHSRHFWSPWTDANAQGTRVRECGYCHEMQARRYVDDWQWRREEASDRLSDQLSCSGDHVWGEWSVPDAQCTQLRKCQKCGMGESRREHSWGAWSLTPDCKEIRACEKCGANNQRNLAPDDARYVENKIKAAAHADFTPANTSASLPWLLAQIQNGLKDLNEREINRVLVTCGQEPGNVWFPPMLHAIDDNPAALNGFFNRLLDELGRNMRYWITVPPEHTRLQSDFAYLLEAWLSDPDIHLQTSAEIVQKALRRTDAKCYPLLLEDTADWIQWIKCGTW